MKKCSRYTKAMMVTLLIIIVLNLLFLNTGLANLYTKNIYPYIADGLAHLTGNIPFAVGEILMYIGILLLLFQLVLLLLLIFLKKRAGFRKFIIRYVKCFGAILMSIVLIYTFCWSIPIHNTLINIQTGNKHTLEEIMILREVMVRRLNNLALKVPRDENGKILYDEEIEIDEKVQKALSNLSEQYPLLEGYYPPMKVALCTDFLEWMRIGGYTYPFTMEVTYNQYLTRLYYPMLSAHEMSHHKGFYKESEANFISFLACASSDDLLLQYSAFENMYYYVNNAYYKSLMNIFPKEEALAIYRGSTKVSQQVKIDEELAQEVANQVYENNVNKKMEVFSSYASDVADVGWETQAELLQEANYDGVVELLLEYYNINQTTK